MKTTNLLGARTSRAFVGPLIVAGAILLNAPSAHAQNVWTLVRGEGKGSVSVNGTSTPWSTSVSARVQMSVKPGQQGTVSSSGAVTLVFGWKPQSWLPNQKPPEKTLSIRVNTSAVLQQIRGGKALSFSSHTVDDGYGTKETIIGGTPLSPNAYMSTSNNHLLSADVSSATFNSTNGMWEVRFLVPTEQATATVVNVSSDQEPALIIAQAGASGVVDTRSVTLSSDIESSYKKSDTLPLNKDGSIALDKLRPSSPSSPSSGPYSVLCERAGDGSIQVHSAAEYVGHDLINNLGDPFWKIDSDVQAQTPGFANPGFSGYKWSLTGYGQLSTIEGFKLAPVVDLGPIFDKRHLSVRPSKPKEVKGQTSTVSVTVTDPTDGAVGSAPSYTINWHLPFENWQLIGSNRLSPQRQSGVSGTGGNGAGPGGSLRYNQSDLDEIEVGDTKELLAKSGSLAKVAAAAGTLVYKLAEEEDPWATAALLFAGEVVSSGSDFAPAPPPPNWIALPTDWSQYKADLQREHDSQGWSDVDPPNPGSPLITHTFTGDKDTLATLIDSANSAQGDVTKDLYFANAKPGARILVSGFVLRGVTRDSYKGDHYDRNGYLGLGYAADNKFGPPLFRMTWTLGTTTPGPNGTGVQAASVDTTSGGNSSAPSPVPSFRSPSGGIG